MQESLLKYLRCPVTGSNLEIKILEYKPKQYNNKSINEIYTAILFSPYGFMFPV